MDELLWFFLLLAALLVGCGRRGVDVLWFYAALWALCLPAGAAGAAGAA